MMLMALMILCGRCVLFSESTDLPEFSEVLVLMAESTAHDWTFNEDDDDEPGITVNRSGWFRLHPKGYHRLLGCFGVNPKLKKSLFFTGGSGNCIGSECAPVGSDWTFNEAFTADLTV
jgi:hypothetical protein